MGDVLKRYHAAIAALGLGVAIGLGVLSFDGHAPLPWAPPASVPALSRTAVATVLVMPPGVRQGPVTAYPGPLTPGALNPNVNQADISSTICVSGWTATIRPPATYTDDLKAKQLISLALPGDMSQYEEDHFIPLELGGNPTDARNLWPQPWTGEYNAHIKDRVENFLHREVCAGRRGLDTAQSQIQTDWVAVLKQNGL